MKNLENFSDHIFESEKNTEIIFDSIINRFSKIPDARKDQLMYYTLSSLIGITSLSVILKLIEKIRKDKPKEYESAKKSVQKCQIKHYIRGRKKIKRRRSNRSLHFLIR